MAKCPKCGREVANPRKKWKMAGRPDRTGKRTELTIGLYDCPKHGAFRSVQSKRLLGPYKPPKPKPEPKPKEK